MERAASCLYIDGENIYGFNGKHLGWFKRRRVMYDKNGLRIGFTNITCPSATQAEPKKSEKKAKPEKTAKTDITLTSAVLNGINIDEKISNVNNAMGLNVLSMSKSIFSNP